MDAKLCKKGETRTRDNLKPWERMMQAGGNCGDFKWRKQQLENGSIIYRRTGQRDIMRAARVLVRPTGKNKYEVLKRNASWFDFVIDPDERKITKDEAEKIAKKYMMDGFCYD